MRPFQLELSSFPTPCLGDGHLGASETGGISVPIIYHRNARARRYRLFVDREGRARVTIPWRGSRQKAERFVREHQDWLGQQLSRAQARRTARAIWRPGTEVLFRGELAMLSKSGSTTVHAA